MTQTGSRFSSRLDWEWKMSPPGRSSTKRRWLLLSDLLIGIAPRADLQPPAHPAQLLLGIGSARRAAHRTLFDALELIGDNRALGLIQKLLVNHRLGNRRRFASHHLNSNM